MANNKKHRIFLAARKRGIDPSEVRDLLRVAGAPPTLSEKPEERIDHPSGRGWDMKAPWSERDPADLRDVTDAFATVFISMLEWEGPRVVCFSGGGWVEILTWSDLRHLAEFKTHITEII